MDKRFYRFLQATCCNWRNSFFIDCQRCDGCSGFLLSVNHNAVPSIIPVAVFEELSGETVDKYDCVGIMTLEGFQRFYTSWLVWNVEDPKRCSLTRGTVNRSRPIVVGTRCLPIHICRRKSPYLVSDSAHRTSTMQIFCVISSPRQ